MEEDELDPRIQVELEKLNTATDEINRLEIELDEANTTFRMLLGECTRRLKVHSSKHGSAIVSARPYYEALDAARTAQQECQKAAVGFQRANEIHEAAKETVALAETRFLSQPEWRFDSAWQEMLNHATLKVREAEERRAESAANHGSATARYKEAQDKVVRLEQRLRRNVAKSRPYFEEKARCNDQLSAQKDVVESLQRSVANVKREYAGSLRRLEGISEEIHRKRANMMEAFPGIREPGVGAELEYQGELDRCDLQSEASNRFDSQSGASSHFDSQSELDGQSESSSVRSERLEGELLVTATSDAKEPVEIRRAMVVNTLELVSGKTDTSTKKRQQDESTLSDLEKDFNRAQIGGKSIESDGSDDKCWAANETGFLEHRDGPAIEAALLKGKDLPSVETADSKGEEISSHKIDVTEGGDTRAKGGSNDEALPSSETAVPKDNDLPSTAEEISKDDNLPSNETADSKDKDVPSIENVALRHNDLPSIEKENSKDNNLPSNEKENKKDNDLPLNVTVDMIGKDVPSIENAALRHNNLPSIESGDSNDKNSPPNNTVDVKDEDLRPKVGASNAQVAAEMAEDSRRTREDNESGETIGETGSGEVSKGSNSKVREELGMGDGNVVTEDSLREVVGQSLEESLQK